MQDKVITVCYGERQEWDSRWDAIDNFSVCAQATEGFERERYTNILLKLMAGEEVCEDGYSSK